MISDKEREDAWTETATIIKEYSDDLVDRWNKEIDTLLVYVRFTVPMLIAATDCWSW